jgi:hypothetical protein
MPKSFFECTEDATASLSNLFNFVWPTAAALWNLRWQVNGFLAEAADATETQLSQRFVAGSGIAGVDLKNACVSQTWENQQERLAEVVLMNAFAVYEHWADQILVSIGQPYGRGIRLQIPGRAPDQIEGVVASAIGTPSSMLSSAFYPIFKAEKRYSWPLIGSHALCYRYFKELRNALAHRGGLASDRAEKAYLAFQPVSDRTSLGMRGALVHYPVVEAQPVRLSLRGVVGFCEILLRMMASIDAELSQAAAAEPYFRERIRLPGANQPTTLSSDRKRRDAQVAKRCMVAGLPRPLDIPAVYAFLRSHRLIRV